MRHLALDEVGSTNTVALEAVRSGDPGPLWVTAERQIAGRGRRSRTWVSERGNLYASLLLVDPAPAEALANLPLVAALGLRNGLASLPARDDVAISIKWPNDILVRDRKCVGILLESEWLRDGRIAVVIGCGVNVAHRPEDVSYAATSLHLEGVTASVSDVFAAVSSGVASAIQSWDRGRGFDVTRADWLRHASGLGSSCIVNLPNETLTGTFTGLDDKGRLVLALAAGGSRLISAGDVFLLGSSNEGDRLGDKAIL